MRKNALPIGILFMVLVVLLAGIGVSYGWWFETIKADANIDTGNLDVYWNAANTNGSGGSPGNASCTATVSSDNNILSIGVTNIHPGYTCIFNGRVHNNGTVPVQISVTGQNGPTAGIDDYLDMTVTDCDAVIAPGGNGWCTATLKMYNDAPNAAQNLNAHYVVFVTADQVH